MTTYVKITWNNGETITRDELTTLSNNQDWLKDNMPALRVTYGGVKDIGNKVICGRTKVAGRDATTFYQETRWGTYFHADARPIVIITLLSTVETQMWVRTQALDGTHGISATGFAVRGKTYPVGTNINYISDCWIDWAAFGW